MNKRAPQHLTVLRGVRFFICLKPARQQTIFEQFPFFLRRRLAPAQVKDEKGEKVPKRGTDGGMGLNPVSLQSSFN